MRRALAVVALLALAGCFTSHQPAPAAPPAVDATPHFPWAATACNARRDVAATDFPWTNRQLPDGYSPAQYFPADRGVFALITVQCDAVVTDNVTPPAPDEVVLGTVNLAGGSASSQSYYLLRAYAPAADGPLARLLQAAGIEVLPATLDMQGWGGALTLTAADHSMQVDPVGPRPGAGASRFDGTEWHLFHDTHDGTLQWTLAVQDYSSTDPNLEQVARMHGGPLAGACPEDACQANTDDFQDFHLDADFDFRPAHGES